VQPNFFHDVDPRDERHQMTVTYGGPPFTAIGLIEGDTVTAVADRGQLTLDARLLVRARAVAESGKDSDYPQALIEELAWARAVVLAFDRLITFEMKHPA
jgi:hypothetical protein